MLKVTGDLWEHPADVRVVTTNGVVKRNGELVMGRGVALEAKQRYPDLSSVLGSLVQEFGNEAFYVPFLDNTIVTFPTKHHYAQNSDLELIRASAIKIANMRALIGRTIVLPRPGCGNGGLRWEDVKAVIAPILDDRFHVITKG